MKIIAALALLLSVCGPAKAFDLPALNAEALRAAPAPAVPQAAQAARGELSGGISQGVRQALSGRTFACRRFRTQPFQLPGGFAIENPDRLAVSFPEVTAAGITVKAEAYKNGVGTMTSSFKIVQDVQEKYSSGKIVIFEQNNIGVESALNGQYAIRTELHLHLDARNTLQKITLEKGVFSGANPFQKNEFSCEL